MVCYYGDIVEIFLMDWVGWETKGGCRDAMELDEEEERLTSEEMNGWILYRSASTSDPENP